MMWLLILLIIVFCLIVFFLGMYAAERNGKAPYPTIYDKKRRYKYTCKRDEDSKNNVKGTSKSDGSGCPAPAEEEEKEDKVCNKHLRHHCPVCDHSGDDGFTTGIAFLSTPAPF
jgi:hypothetical protein